MIMSKCVGNCAVCDLPVDKQACCAFQTFKNVLELRKKVSELEQRVAAPDEVIQYKTLDDITTEE